MHNPGGDIDDGGGYAHVGSGDMLEIYVSSIQFCCEPKNTLKNEVDF